MVHGGLRLHCAPSALSLSLAALLQVGGLLLVAPEHWLSLRLKGQELWLRSQDSNRTADMRKQDAAVWAKLQHLAALPCLDLLDESDELLHPRWTAWRAGVLSRGFSHAVGAPQLERDERAWAW
jgi:hypothetical protein